MNHERPSLELPPLPYPLAKPRGREDPRPLHGEEGQKNEGREPARHGPVFRGTETL